MIRKTLPCTRLLFGHGFAAGFVVDPAIGQSGWGLVKRAG
jgi:hypothetical protein